MSREIIRIPPKLIPAFSKPRGYYRHIAIYGGRGSGKSYSVAKMVAAWGVAEKLRILCTRELQDSIKESFHAELKKAISESAYFSSVYDVGVDYLRGSNGTEFLFRGLRHNISSIKSTAAIDVCVVEEAEDVPEHSWHALEPTIRAPRSCFIVLWNPKRRDSYVNKRYVESKPERSIVVKMNYNDNPWFPQELEELRKEQQKGKDQAFYRHVWEGEYLERSEAQVFQNCFIVQNFTPNQTWAGPYFGLDFGFSQDPTACVKCWINNNILYIEEEAGGIGLELDKTTPFLKTRMHGIEYNHIYADSARPESISYLSRHGLPRIKPVKKGKGSVEDGVEHIKSFDQVVIHTRCAKTYDEFCNYSYKLDRETGKPITTLQDAHNHYIDAIRYALEPVRLHKKTLNFEAMT